MTSHQHSQWALPSLHRQESRRNEPIERETTGEDDDGDSTRAPSKILRHHSRRPLFGLKGQRTSLKAFKLPPPGL